MPGRFFLTTPISAVAQALDVPAPPGPADPPRYNMQPGQEVYTLTADGLQKMRWGIIPVGRVNARGRPVMETIINARSETVFDKSAFDGVGRAIVPVNGWYEWTGKARAKTAWSIRHAQHELLYFAAITDAWSAPNGQAIHQVATVTCEPNADVRDIHHRMGVILDPGTVSLWLTGTQDQVRKLMVPLPDGSLQVAKAAGVDWSGP